MERFIPKTKRGPEAEIQDAIVKMLKYKGWFTKETHGNMFQTGLPDVFTCHRLYGTRWIEVKNPTHYRFTAAQLRDFPLFVSNGCGIWVLVAPTEEEYQKLFKPCNWYQYIKM